MLRPDSSWQWYFDDTRQCLAIELNDDMHFVTPYLRKQLGPDAVATQGFSLEDMECYLQIAEHLESSDLSLTAAHMTQIALNATAVKRFYRPLMPKSWFFQRHQCAGHHHQVALLNTNNESGIVLVVESGHNASVCMLLSESLELGPQKKLSQFEVIKVCNDCLQPYFIEVEQRRIA